MLPISVANELRHSRPVPAKKYDCVTLLFSGIVGFGAYCAAHTDSSGAMKIVNMLNQLYTAFDVLTDPKKNPNVYKVSIHPHRHFKLQIQRVFRKRCTATRGFGRHFPSTGKKVSRS